MLLEHNTDERDNDLERIRKRLQSRSTTERAEAETALGQLSPRELIDLMALEQRNRKQKQRWMIAGLACYLTIFVALLVAFHTAQMILYLGGFSGLLAGARAFSPTHKGAARALAKWDDVTGVGALVEATEIPDEEVRSPVRVSLTRLLPRLRVSDAALLTTEQRRIVRKWMNANVAATSAQEHRSLVVAALKALEQVGDESFLETVKDLASTQSGFAAASEVRQAAAECLPFLSQRIENARMRHDLLRAASATQAYDPDALLRPAEPGGHTDAAQLLRPTSDE